MEKIAEHIADLLQDYREEDHINFDADHVIKWVTQFELADQEFILQELLHFLPKV
ncbi:MAG: hypothetical protein AAF806_10720 [Bacteroidota bacterium]